MEDLGKHIVDASGATTAMSVLVLMPRLGIPLIAISGAVIAAQRVAVVGVAQAVTEGVDFVVGDLVMMVVIWAVREGMDRRAVTTAAPGTRNASTPIRRWPARSSIASLISTR